MDDSRWERWSALGGVVFVVLILASALLPGSPARPGDSTAKIEGFVYDKAKEIRWSAFLGGLAVLALFWFAGAVWRFLRRAEGGSPRLTVVAVLGASFATVMATISTIVLAGLAMTEVQTVGPSSTRALYIVSFNIGAGTAFGVAVFVGAFSMVMIRSGALPAWIGWIGIVIAVVFIASGGALSSTRGVFFDLQFGGFLAFAVWLVIVSIMMFRAVPDDEPAVAAS